MKSEWRLRRIGDLGRVVTGKTPSSSRPECFGSDFPFITPTDMHDRRYADVTERYLSEEGAKSQQTLIVPPKAVCVSCIGWQMGKVVVTSRHSFTNQQLHTIVPNRDTDSLFLYYSLSTRRAEFLSLGSAAGVRTPIINKSTFCDLPVLLPGVDLQRKIALILSAYDDLIENNVRRIAILHSMTQAVYREWFVNLRFPGHEKVRFVNSTLGRIPEGWKAGRLDDVLVLQRGFDLPVGKRQAGDVPVYAAAGIVGTHNEAKVKGPGVLTGRSGSLGTVTYVHEDYWPLNTALWVKVFKGPSPLFAYFTLQSIDSASFNSGAAVPTLNRNDVHGLPILIPPDRCVADFHQIEQPLFDCVRTLRKKNENLRKTRDLLLPKLVSGHFDVENIDIDTGQCLEEPET